jgi:hypothetical protein
LKVSFILVPLSDAISLLFYKDTINRSCLRAV